MNQILQLKKNILLIFVFINCISYGQEKNTLYNEIIHHISSKDFLKNGVTLSRNIETVQYQNAPCKEMIIEKSTIQNVINKKSKFISLELPILEGKQCVLFLKKRTLFDDEFKIIIQNQNLKQEITEKSVCLAYSGLIEGEETNSLVSIVLYNDIIIGTILIGDKTFSLMQINNTNRYRLYESKPDINQPQFACGVNDASDNTSLKNAVSNRNAQSTIPKCIKLHFEITKSLNGQFGGVNQSITEFLTLFNLVQTKFANEGITVRVSYLKIWNTDDPYFQTWVGTPGSPGSFQDLGFSSFQNLSGNIDGNIGILLGTFSGGIAGLSGGAPCSNQGYNTDTIYPNSINQNAVVIMHEIGHNLGSHHTHWCGWVGGAIDNCSATEGGCQPGPAPTNGGTIMSYCGGYEIINNGFGTQPNAVILNTTANESCITSCNSDINCEDNIVNASNVTNTTSTSFTVSWTSSYPMKVYYKEASASSFTLLNSVALPNNSYTINYVPVTNCTIQKFEIKLVSVCPNGDSKPTIIVYSPQAHSKPYVGLQDNYVCNISNPTVNNLVAMGQNLKWYTTETGGTPISNSFIIPLNTYIAYYVSQTVNGCESERTRSVVYIQNIEMPVGPNVQQFQCEFPKATDLYSVSNQYSSPNSSLRWYLNATDPNYIINDQFMLTNNSYYYAANVSSDNVCVSTRLPVLISTNPTYYNIPFTESFNSPFNCDLGYASPYYANNSGPDYGNNLVLNSVLSNITNYVVTKKVNLVANTPIQISLKVKHLNLNNPSNPLKIKINSNSTSTIILGQILPSSMNTFDSYTFNYTPTVSTLYRIFFEYNCSIPNIGYVIDDFSITNQNLSIIDVNIQDKIHIYPNPTKNIVNVLSQNEIIKQMNVYDIYGRLLKSVKGSTNSEIINIQDLPNAIYLISLKTDEGYKTIKILKE